MSEASVVKQVDRTPSSSYFNSHYFCDYIEFLALISDDLISEADIYDKFSEDNKIDANGDNESSIVNDKWSSRILEWFSLLETRQSRFQNSYPFIIDSSSIKLRPDINQEQYTYIFLLLSSTRKYISDANLLTTDFEALSFEVLKTYIPSFSSVYQFGKSNIDHERYTGHITEKIDKLADDLKCSPKYKSHFFADNDSGDGGLDLVAWVPFSKDAKIDSNQSNIQVYLCQCATGKDWLNKQDDTDKFHKKYISFESDINSVMFIPYDGRNHDGLFNEDSKMGSYLCFDRFRLLSILEDYSLIQRLPSFSDVIQRVLAYEEDIV